MLFSKKTKCLLSKMRICGAEYESALMASYGDKAKSFSTLLDFFRETALEKMTVEAFNNFMENKINRYDENLLNKLYDIFNYLVLFKRGGVFELYRFRQAEWDGPRVAIKKEDAPCSDVEDLESEIEIYRGMSQEEFISGDFGQSWTVDKAVAERFAFDTYPDNPPGLVIAGIVAKNAVIFFSKTDNESEVIVERGSVKSTTICYPNSAIK
ncbi:MAG: hypothetical protein RBR42_08665 [Desulfomicrobium sp.]|nr:hypothetical protein [Desulfomicrobium sp.]